MAVQVVVILFNLFSKQQQFVVVNRITVEEQLIGMSRLRDSGAEKCCQYHRSRLCHNKAVSDRLYYVLCTQLSLHSALNLCKRLALTNLRANGVKMKASVALTRVYIHGRLYSTHYGAIYY